MHSHAGAWEREITRTINSSVILEYKVNRVAREGSLGWARIHKLPRPLGEGKPLSPHLKPRSRLRHIDRSGDIS